MQVDHSRVIILPNQRTVNLSSVYSWVILVYVAFDKILTSIIHIRFCATAQFLEANLLMNNLVTQVDSIPI